jgi:hypothetical protein
MNYLINNLLNNELVSICLISGIVCLTTGYFIKSYLDSTHFQTPNSPPTFNFRLDQLKEIENQSQEESNKNLSLDQLKQLEERLDNEGEFDDLFKEILTEEEYKQYQEELLDPENDFSQNLQDIFDNFDNFI